MPPRRQTLGAQPIGRQCILCVTTFPRQTQNCLPTPLQLAALSPNLIQVALCMGATPSNCKHQPQMAVIVKSVTGRYIHPMFQNMRMTYHWRRAMFVAAGVIISSLGLYLGLEWLGFR